MIDEATAHAEKQRQKQAAYVQIAAAIVAYARLPAGEQKIAYETAVLLQRTSETEDAYLAVNTLEECLRPPSRPIATEKEFIVAAISDNANSFGLRNFIFVARDGTAWQAVGNYMRIAKYPRGTKLKVRLDHTGDPDFTALEFELPEPMPETDVTPCGKAPQEVVDQVWS
jgi:hypothetical protein